MIVENTKNPFFHGLKKEDQMAVILLASGMPTNQVAKNTRMGRAKLYFLRYKNETFKDALTFERNIFINEFREEIFEIKRKSLQIVNGFLDDKSIDINKKLKIASNIIFNRPRTRKQHKL